jgi:hypothetical protein
MKKSVDDLARLERLAGMKLHTEGLKDGRQCLICRSWRADKGCTSCGRPERASVPRSPQQFANLFRKL